MTCSFVTEFSHLLADERAVEKAAMLPDVYDISDRKIKSRTVTTITHNWEELIDVTLLRKQMLSYETTRYFRTAGAEIFKKSYYSYPKYRCPAGDNWMVSGYRCLFLKTKSDIYDDTELLELPDHGGIFRFAK